MRPTSIIFLILSVILIAGGAVTCVTAKKMADSNNIELFFQETDINENGIETHEFSETAVNKITVKLKEARVNLIGGSETSYIKLTNFSKNTFEYSISNKNLTVDDSINLYSLFQFTAGGIDFSGLRHFLYINRYKDKQKTIDIYINKNVDIKQFHIAVESGDITISDLSKQADYLLTTGNGDINIDDLKTISTITAEIGTGNFSIDTISLSGNIDIKTVSGTVYAKLRNTASRGYELSAANGTIEYFGEPKSKIFNLEPMNETTSFKADVQNGNIIIELNPAAESNYIPK